MDVPISNDADWSQGRGGEQMSASLTPKAIAALELLRGTSINDTRSAQSLARKLWPDRFADCGTSLRRGGLYRAAGAFYSKLMKRGLCGHWITDFGGGYYITKAGLETLSKWRKAHSESD